MQFETKGLEAYITDQNLEAQDGVVIVFPENRKLRIRRAGGSNKAYTRHMQAVLRPFKRQIDAGTFSDEQANQLLREAYAKHIVQQWWGIRDSEGADVPCTKENIIAFFEAFPEIFSEIIGYANNMATFIIEQAKEAADTLEK